MESEASPHLLHFMVGALLVGSFLLRHIFEKIGIQSLISYLLMGIAIAALNSQFQMMGDGAEHVMRFMANIGLIVLLFRTGLESDTRALREELAPAGLIWFGNFLKTESVMSNRLPNSLFICSTLEARLTVSPINVYSFLSLEPTFPVTA